MSSFCCFVGKSFHFHPQTNLRKVTKTSQLCCRFHKNHRQKKNAKTKLICMILQFGISSLFSHPLKNLQNIFYRPTKPNSLLLGQKKRQQHKKKLFTIHLKWLRLVSGSLSAPRWTFSKSTSPIRHPFSFQHPAAAASEIGKENMKFTFLCAFIT